jgi:hypothetical protein
VLQQKTRHAVLQQKTQRELFSTERRESTERRKEKRRREREKSDENERKEKKTDIIYSVLKLFF